MSEIYGLEALRKLRQQQAAAQEPPRQGSLLADISPDVPMDDATITVWNGEGFVAMDQKWFASRPVATEERPDSRPPQSADIKITAIEEDAQEGLWNE